jgi:drug/metabolite transporter (DMT)-like permease
LVRPGTAATPPARTTPDLLGGSLVVASAVQFGAVVVLGKVATRSGLGVASILAFRFAVAATLLAGALVAQGQPLLAAKRERGRLFALGVAGYAVESGLFFAALPHGTVPAVTLLFFTYPVFVALVAAATGKGLPGPLLGGSLAAAVMGAIVVALAGGRAAVDATGVAFALGSALTFSLYLSGAGAVLKRTNSLAGAMWVSGAAASALACWALVTGTAAWPAGWRQWGPVLGMAGFTAGAFVGLFAGLRRLGAVRTSIVSATEPLAAATFAVIFLGESLRPGTLVGGVLILGGAVAASVARAGGPEEPQGP